MSNRRLILMCHCRWWRIPLNNHLQSYPGDRQLSLTRSRMNTDGWDSDCFLFLLFRSSFGTARWLAKLSRRVPNNSGWVPFYTGAFRTVSAGVANADSALPYFNGTSTQNIINRLLNSWRNIIRKLSRHLNQFFKKMKSTLKSTE